MKIILSEVEIVESIQDFIKKTMSIPEDKEFVVDVSSSRGVGVTAEISIESKKQTCEVEEPKEETPIKNPFAVVEKVEEETPQTPKKSFFSNLA